MSWVLHSDRFIHTESDEIDSLIRDNPEALGTVATTETVPQNAEIPVLDKHIDLALKQVVRSAKPRLILKINSHGGWLY